MFNTPCRRMPTAGGVCWECGRCQSLWRCFCPSCLPSCTRPFWHSVFPPRVMTTTIPPPCPAHLRARGTFDWSWTSSVMPLRRRSTVLVVVTFSKVTSDHTHTHFRLRCRRRKFIRRSWQWWTWLIYDCMLKVSKQTSKWNFIGSRIVKSSRRLQKCNSTPRTYWI